MGTKVRKQKGSLRSAGAFAVVAAVAAGTAQAEDTAALRILERPTLNFMGVPGLIDMPVAYPMRDADASMSLSGFKDTQRMTLHFQITPRLSGVFRYAHLDGYGPSTQSSYYDRSFDAHYLLFEETPMRPAIAVGLRDFGGTGIYAGEYVVATKSFGPLSATGGIGWGRFGSFGGFTNPLGVINNNFKTRPGASGNTGQFEIKNWFRGDAALFGGVQYQVNDRMVLTAEYSSDAYDLERARMGFEHKSPLNFGMTYRFRSGVDLSAGYLYGSTVALQLSYTFSPKEPRAVPGGIEEAPAPVAVRPAGSAYELGWVLQEGMQETLRVRLAKAMALSRLQLEAVEIETWRVRVRYRSPDYNNEAEALGRLARLLTNLMPASIDTFELVPVTATGVQAARIVLRRSDLEELEHAPDGAWQSFARAQFKDAYPEASGYVMNPEFLPKLTWGFGPYLKFAFFDPDAPLRYDYGFEVHASYELQPGLILSGEIDQRMGGTIDQMRASNSVLPHVRSDVGLYAKGGDTTLPYLTLAKYFRPGTDLYGRVTVGYLESMYGGVSGEVLWKPVDSNIGLGVELNYVRQRSFEQKFAFQDYEIVTGHVSAYLDDDSGFQYQLDAGRYLAGDWGATLSVDREFDNGIRIGAFATLTDVSFDDFGEGSFDKGFRFEIPISAILGRPSKRVLTRTIRPVQRDGGARLEVGGRLYRSVREYHRPELQAQWGRFWR